MVSNLVYITIYINSCIYNIFFPIFFRISRKQEFSVTICKNQCNRIIIHIVILSWGGQYCKCCISKTVLLTWHRNRIGVILSFHCIYYISVSFGITFNIWHHYYITIKLVYNYIHTSYMVTVRMGSNYIIKFFNILTVQVILNLCTLVILTCIYKHGMVTTFH